MMSRQGNARRVHAENDCQDERRGLHIPTISRLLKDSSRATPRSILPSSVLPDVSRHHREPYNSRFYRIDAHAMRPAQSRLPMAVHAFLSCSCPGQPRGRRVVQATSSKVHHTDMLFPNRRNLLGDVLSSRHLDIL